MYRLYEGDCIEVMKTLPNKSIQLVMTSPPYNHSFRNDGKKYPAMPSIDKMKDEDYIKWSVDIFKQYNRILKDKGVVAYNMGYSTRNPSLIYQVIAEIMKETDFVVADTYTWKKSNTMPCASSINRTTRICEFVYIFVKKDHLIDFDCNKKVKSVSKTGQKFYEIYYNYIEAKCNDGSTDIHKATYSTDLAKYFIDLYSFENSVVLDNFVGTGTTIIAALELNRKSIGIDLCKEYIEYTQKRIDDYGKVCNK